MGINKQTFRSGPFQDFFAQGVEVGGTLYLAGQIGVDGFGTAGDGLVEQTKLAYANIDRVLAEFGAGMDNIVDETIFVTDINDLMANVEEVFAAREEAYGGKPEVSQTLVQAAALVLPDLKIEIKCIARV